MSGPEYDAELEAFLKRRSMMHRRLSDIDHAEPSVEIDRLVLKRAREAIDTPEQPLFRTSRWALPIGLAAAILIAFTVVLNLEHQGAKSNASPTAAVAPQAPAPAVARAASVREAERVEQQRVVSDSAANAQRDAHAKKNGDVPAGPSSSTALAASTGAAASHGVLVTPAPAVAASPPVAASADPHSSPDAWVREINRLRAAGKTADADRELTAFREAYPTHPAYSVAKPPTR